MGVVNLTLYYLSRNQAVLWQTMGRQFGYPSSSSPGVGSGSASWPFSFVVDDECVHEAGALNLELCLVRPLVYLHKACALVAGLLEEVAYAGNLLGHDWEIGDGVAESVFLFAFCKKMPSGRQQAQMLVGQEVAKKE